MTRAMSEAIECARTVGIGWCAARNTTHTGAIGYFALQAAEQGFAGIAMSASGPMMAYPGTRVGAVSSNPIAFAVPRRNGRPYLIDFSTGVVANGKIMGAADRGEKIPIGWGLDAQGHDTTDPKAVETVLPLGGAKGAGLSFMIECLSSLLAVQSAHRAGPGGSFDRGQSVPQRLGRRDQSRRLRQRREFRDRGRAARPVDCRTSARRRRR